MKKLSLFAVGDDCDAIVSGLMKLRCIEIVTADAEKEALPACEYPGEKADAEASVARIRSAVAALEKYSVRKFALLKPKITVDRDAFASDGSSERAWETVGKVEENLKETSRIEDEIRAAEDLLRVAEPWYDDTLPLDFEGTATTSFVRGSLPGGTDIGALTEALAERFSYLTETSSGGGTVYVGVYTLNGYSDAAAKLLASVGFVKAALPKSPKTASALSREASSKVSRLGKEKEKLTEELRTLALEIDDLRVLCDIESTVLETFRNREKMLSAGSVNYLTGWAPAEKQEKVEKFLSGFACAYGFEDPTEEDDPPVLLKNNAFAKNFEWVVGMYSYPKYGSYDPTFIMAIFFCILFGMMFADAGYGLLFILVAFVGVPALKIKGKLKKNITMFGWCGISCVIMGILFGGFFGDLPYEIATKMFGAPEFKQALWIDPVKDPLSFLIVSLGVGAAHLIAGMAVKFYILCREGHVLDAILDIGLWWVLFGSVALVALVPNVGIWVLVGAALAVILTGGRREKNWLMKPIKGFLSLYGLINYCSDLLSYSRILALGLASSIIAMVLNIIGTMPGNTVAGWALLIAVGIVGHPINIALNALGAFVHTSRLQYIEFFGKFYEDGGREFVPATEIGEFTDIDDE